VKNAIYYTCKLCGSKFQFGPHVYDGKWLNYYKMTLCRTCYDINWDGFAPHYEGVIERHLVAEDIPLPARNRSGWYPRDVPTA
jgi:hypothetical protein